MPPATARRARRHIHAFALVALALLLLTVLRSVPLAPAASARAASGGLQGFAGRGAPVDQADNCIISTNTIPPTPLPLATAQPTANAGGPYSGTIGNPILFVGSGTPSRNSTIITCVWNFGDGTTANSFTDNHVYAVAGTYTATLTVTDSSGATATASATVTVGGFVPLCQESNLAANQGLGPCVTSGSCIASLLVNGCQTVCAATGEVFVPGNCPGPSTGNQITINGPFNAQIEQPVTVNANLNLPAYSDLANNDRVTFDFGDGTVVTTSGSGSVGSLGTITTSSASTTSNGTSTSTISSTGGSAVATTGIVGAAAFEPAPLQATHAYTQAGTYTVTATVYFSNGTISVAKTTATITGSLPPATLPAAAPTPPPMLVTLSNGCNHVTLTFPDQTPITTVASAIQNATLVSIYQITAGAPILGYFPNPSAPSNLLAVQHGDMVIICVQGNGALTEPVS